MRKLATKQRASVIRALVEGCSIRSTCRMTGITKRAVMKLVPDLGEACRESSGKGLKLHTHFELLKAVPTRIDVTDGGAGERAQLNQTLLADRVYVMDRGYASFELFDAIEDAPADTGSAGA